MKEQGYEIEDVKEEGWQDPLLGLKPVSETKIKKLEAAYGPLPESYKLLLTQAGAGIILSAYEDEPLPFRILAPAEIPKIKKAAASWLSEKDGEMLKKSRKISFEKMIPIFSDDSGEWGLLAQQKAGDDRVFLYAHDHENGVPFAGNLPLLKFFETFVAKAKKLETINSFDGIK